MQPRQRSKHVIIADAVGLAHCIVANIVVIAGYFYDFFKVIDPFDGFKFVYIYFDQPVYFLFQGIITRVQNDQWFLPVLAGEVVIILSSLLYGVIAYLMARLVFPAVD